MFSQNNYNRPMFDFMEYQWRNVWGNKLTPIWLRLAVSKVALEPAVPDTAQAPWFYMVLPCTLWWTNIAIENGHL